MTNKKIVKLIVLIIIFAAFFTMPISAQENEREDVYGKQYAAAEFDKAKETLPNQAADTLDELGIDPEKINFSDKFSFKSIVNIIFNFAAEGISAPVKLTSALIGVLLIFASVNACLSPQTDGTRFTLFACFSTIIIMLNPIFGLISACETAMKCLSSFMLAFVPIFAGIVASSGKAAAAEGFSVLLLGASEVMSQFVTFGFTPIMKSCMCLGFCSGISPIRSISGICEFIKKAATFLFATASTVFLGVLSIQNLIKGAADDMGLKASKMFLSGVPVAGTAIAETLNTVKGCLGILRSGVGIYGVAAVFVILLPLLCESIFYRVGIWLSVGVSDTFEMKEISELLKSVDSFLAVLSGFLLFCGLIFIISLTVVIK